jgi:predicted ATPase/class 3 adenylate cyclase
VGVSQTVGRRRGGWGDTTGMVDLPTGVITMLFSDIEGSTLTLNRLGSLWGEALSVQRSVLRQVFASQGGVEMGTEGDSFFVVFTSARQAVLAAVEGQRLLQRHQWPEGVPIRVRMGIHTGEPQRHEDGYIGLDVHRAARIAGTAAGGQIVVSEATRPLVGNLGDAVAVRDLGWHRLKDLVEPEHVFDLVVPGLLSDFPPLRSIGKTANLPVAATPLIGRDGEVSELRSLIGDPQVRLVTLTGPGGTGKTRLAVGIAHALEHQFPAGIFFADVSAADRDATMWLAIANAVDAAGEAEELPHARVLRFLADREALLVLDNLEQIAEADQVVGTLLSKAPRLKVVATSRRPLHLVSEYEHPVPPLELPGGRLTGPADAARSGAVELFVRRSRMVRPSFEMTDANVGAVVELCRRLDGLPLAIELAAARTKLLSPQALLKRLDHTLGSGVAAPDRAERQRTLAATIAWSYDLLTPDEQRVFRRLGVFSSQCDLSAVEAVLETQGVDPLDTVAHLVDVSLVRIVDGSDGEPRISLLETIRAFARHELDVAGEFDEIRLRHARWCSTLAAEMERLVSGPRQMEALDRIADIEEEVRAALDWCLRPVQEVGPERAGYGFALVRSMTAYWYRFGYAAEGRGWLGRALEIAGGVESTDALNVLHGLGILQVQQGEVERAIESFERALAMARGLGERSLEARELNSLGIALRMAGQLDEARRRIARSAEVARELGEPARESTALTNLAVVLIDVAAPAEGLRAAREALAASSRLGDEWAAVTDEFNLSLALLFAEGPEAAFASLSGLTPRVMALSDAELTVEVVEMFAAIVAGLGNARLAARLLAASDSHRATAGMPRSKPDQGLLERAFDTRAARQSDEWSAGYAEGVGLDIHAALTQALSARSPTEMVTRSAD